MPLFHLHTPKVSTVDTALYLTSQDTSREQKQNVTNPTSEDYGTFTIRHQILIIIHFNKQTCFLLFFCWWTSSTLFHMNLQRGQDGTEPSFRLCLQYVLHVWGVLL